MKEYAFFTTLPYLLLFANVGMILHFFKKKIKGETLIDIKDYFRNHFKSTVTAVLATIIFTAAYYLEISDGDTGDILAAFGIGYTCDSLFNKWDIEKPGTE
jgi:hypothetical protein